MSLMQNGFRRLRLTLFLAAPCCWIGGQPTSGAGRRVPYRVAARAQESSDASWEPPEKIYSNAIRSLPGSATAYRKVLPLGKAVLRRKAKLVKPERISKEKSQNVAEELVSVMRGPKLPGRDFKGGFLTAPHLGTPSRLIAFEDPPVAVERLSQEERALQGRERAFGCKAIFNPRLRVPASNVTSVFWEKDPSIPGYRALVERPASVRVQGYDPKGQAVDFVASGWEARLLQQANDVLDGVNFIDRCIMRSLCHLDARNDPLPSDCPVLGTYNSRPARPALSAEELSAAESGGSKGMLGFLPSFVQPSVLLIGSLLLRLPAKEVTDFSASEVEESRKELRNALESGEHPLGLAAPQFGKGLRIVAIGETQDAIDRLTTRAQISEEHRVFKTTILVNPKVTPKPGTSDAYFFERSASVPGYEAVVGRALEVEVEGFNEEGRAVNFDAKGWQARQLQHTADMLEGVLYVDRMETRSFRIWLKLHLILTVLASFTSFTMPAAMKVMKATKAKKVNSAMKTKGQKAMTKGSLLTALADATELKKGDVGKILNSLTEIGTEEVKKSGKFILPGLCMIKTRQKPATKAGKKLMFGKEVMVKAQPAKTVVKASPVAALKSQI